MGNGTVETHVFPWWMGYLQASSLRRARDNPEAMLGPYLAPGMTALDAGCAMGYFSLPMARMVGEEGRVICVDLQERMIRVLRRRAGRARLDGRVETRVCAVQTLCLSDLRGRVDFALAYAVLHEVPDPVCFVSELSSVLRRGAPLFLGEPTGPVSEAVFRRETSLIESLGLEPVAPRHQSASGRTAIFRKGPVRHD